MADEETFESLRPLLFSIAYRMLGTVSEAEDVVQDAYLRYRRAIEDGTEIGSLKPYLSATTTRLAIDHLRSARVRREQYVGQWLPEPLVTDPLREAGPDAADAADAAEMADSISMAFLLLLERLSPVERAVFLLHDVFGYPFAEISEIVERSEENCRQLGSRARRHVHEGRPRFEADRARRDELARRFLAAVEDGDTQGLVSVLARDVVMSGDGGGKAPALATPIVGRERAVRFLMGLWRQGARIGVRSRLIEANGAPAVLTETRDGRIVNLAVLEIANGAVRTIRSVVNPDKLRHLGPVANVADLLSRPG